MFVDFFFFYNCSVCKLMQTQMLESELLLLLSFHINSCAGHGYMGDDWVMSLSYSWIFLAGTILSWNIGCLG